MDEERLTEAVRCSWIRVHGGPRRAVPFHDSDRAGVHRGEAGSRCDPRSRRGPAQPPMFNMRAAAEALQVRLKCTRDAGTASRSRTAPAT